MIQIIECPRDAMQGMSTFVPTEIKIKYLNSLLRCGFHSLDFGSFVSAKAIPQMADTSAVLKGLDLSQSKTRLLAIIANSRGAQDALVFEEIAYLGYPFSISENFQLRNTQATIDQSVRRVGEIADLCAKHRRQLVIYISMAFGNPYGERWHPDIAIQWAEKLHSDFGIKIIALSDTIGSSTRESITQLFSALIPSLPNVQFGAHLHTKPDSWQEKIDAAYQAGCRRFDGALKGFGGCPMADDKLTGNMPTELMVAHLEKLGVDTGVNQNFLSESLHQAVSIF